MLRSRTRRLAAAAGLLVLASCAYPQHNRELAKIDEGVGYQWAQIPPNSLRDTLIIVSASGGGTRAAALALGALRGLDAVKLPKTGGSLLDEVDVISSVSGGSVTAAWFALRGANGFDELEHRFLRRNGMAALMWRGLNPYGLARLATPGTSRIDLLVEYLDDTLFAKATYADLLRRKHGPYLIVNASDMVEGSVFPFTQATFDLLCSDLASFPLARAVAASAAFPIAMTPVTLTNYSPCPAQAALGEKWPPWVFEATGMPWHDNRPRARRGRAAALYLKGGGKGQQTYVHLLDGGVADNVGLSEPFRLLTTTDVPPFLFNQITNGDIRHVVFIAVNARTVSRSDLNVSPAPPGVIDMLVTTLNAPMDNATSSRVGQVDTLLADTLAGIATRSDMPQSVRDRLRGLKTSFVPVEFEAIPSPDCRASFQDLATSWSLAKTEIDALIQMGGALLFDVPAFRGIVAAHGATLPPGATVESACKTLADGRR